MLQWLPFLDDEDSPGQISVAYWSEAPNLASI